MDQAREHLLDSCIREFYLRSERPSFAALVREVKRQFAAQQSPVPHYRTVKRRVEGLDMRYAACVAKVRIPVMWATDYGDVGQSRSEATLVVF